LKGLSAKKRRQQEQANRTLLNTTKIVYVQDKMNGTNRGNANATLVKRQPLPDGPDCHLIDMTAAGREWKGMGTGDNRFTGGLD